MSERDKLRKLDDMISSMEIFQKRAHIMAAAISNDFFDLTDDGFKLFYFDTADTKFDILFDYVNRNTELLREIRALLDDGCKNSGSRPVNERR